MKADKNAAKETYYTQMIEYEVEQKLIRDIVWLDKTREAAMERADRNSKYKAELQERNEQRKKIQEERDKRDAQYKEREVERQADYEAKQKAWETS